MTSKHIKSVLGHVASFALAAGLLYLALRGVDFSEVMGALRRANYIWLIPLAILTIVSHIIRCWRWNVLLEELPPVSSTHRRIGMYNSFTALIIGYFANYAAPRVGELVRAGLLARNERLGVSGVIGTVVLERILDVLVLIVLVGVTSVMLLDRSEVIHDLFIAPVTRQWSRIPTPILILLAVAILLGAVALYRLWKKPHHDGGRLRGLIDSFFDGLATLYRTPRKTEIVVSTVLMWGCYVVMTHLPFVILGMTGTYHLTLLDSFYVMTLGAIGVAIPAPGGTGSYHYIAIQSLVYLFGVDQSPAATYAVLTHAAQLVLYALLGTIFIATQKTSVGEIRRLEKEAEVAAHEAHR